MKEISSCDEWLGWMPMFEAGFSAGGSDISAEGGVCALLEAVFMV
jgi:hypothetical protein